jgi:alpha-glucosidase
MLNKLKATTRCALLLLAGFTTAAQAAPVVLKSPHGKIEIWIATVRGQAEIAEEGRLAYRVAYCGQPVIQWSSLGLALEGAPALGTGMRIEATQTASQNESWTAVQGKANPILNLYNAVTVRAVEPGANGRRLTVEARAYNDGVAFRYVVPEQPALKDVRILNELTQFNFAKDAQTWPLISRGFQTSNEDDYHELMIGGWHPEYLVNLPLLLHLPGVAWVGLTEADLEDYPNMFLTAVAGKNLAARLAPYVEGANTSAETAPIFDPKADAKKV